MADDLRRFEGRAEFLRGGGQSGARMRALDWTATALGPAQNWPQALKVAARLMLTTRHPVSIFWGPEGIYLHNDAAGEFLGEDRRARAMGRPGAEVWSETWSDRVEPQIRHVLSGGEATWEENSYTPILRNGRLDDAWWTYSYSPIDDETAPAGVGGVLVIANETTREMLARREFELGRARLASLFEQAPSFICVMRGPDHVFEFVNAECRRLFGCDGWIGRPARDANSQLEGQGYFELLDRVYSTGERHVAYASPGHFRVGGGGEPQDRYIDYIYAPIRDADGKVTGIYCQGNDVTDRVRAEAGLAESESRFRALAETIPALLFVTGPDGANTYTNAPYQRFSGLSAAELSGDGWVRSLHPDDQDRAAQAWDASWRGGAPYDIEMRFRRHDGVHRWHSVRGNPIKDGGQITGWVGVAVDIHNQKLAEDALRDLNANLERRVGEALAERKLWADLMEDSDSYITVIDTEYRLLAINKAARIEAERFYGVPPTIGANLFDLIGDWPEARERTSRSWVRPLAGEAYSTTEPFAEKSGQVRHHEIRFGPLRDTAGAIIGAYQIAYDVTDRVMEQARLAEAQAALRQAQKMESIGQLTGGVAHDFNNLLTPIVGALDMLERRGVGDERDHRLIAGALQSAERARTLVQRLLAFARRQPLQPAAVDVGRLVRGVTDLVASTLGPQIRLVLDVEPDLPPALADANQLEMALLNLCVNARDAMPAGGVLTLAAHNCSMGVGDHTDLPRGEYVCLKVKDTGVGMDEETRARAVEPFFSTKGLGKGTGLGLSMVDGLVRQLGGALAIESRPAEGSTVTLWLPLSGDAAKSEAAPPRETSRPPSAGTVLLVDDESLVRTSTAQMIEAFGFMVLESSSGEEALERLQAGFTPDLLVTDQLMGGMTGDALVRAARRMRPDLPVLIVSGYADMDAIPADVPRLAKPFRADALREALEAIRA